MQTRSVLMGSFALSLAVACGAPAQVAVSSADFEEPAATAPASALVQEGVDAVKHGELTDDDPRVEQDNSCFDEYEFELRAGWWVTLEMESEEFDTFLWLISPQGESVAQNDDRGGEHHDTNSRISRRIDLTGTYTVRANSYDGSGRGRYQLRVVAGPGDPPEGESETEAP